MALAKLSIDLEARLAGLQAGLDKAGMLAEKQADRIERAFATVRGVAGGLGAGLVASITVGGLASMIRSTVDGIDALNDLKDATGASIENLSALEDVAIRTGTSFDTVGSALVKLNQQLGNAKPGSDAEAAFKAIGLSVKELQALDPAEALRRVAVALNGYADDGNKARLVQELFGKSIREVAPLLKDLAESGQLNAKVTTEQAEAAEKFNKQFTALNKNATDLTRTLLLELIPTLNTYLETVNRAANGGGKIFGKEIVSEVDSIRLQVAVSKVEDLQAALSKDPSNRGLAQALKQARTDADALLATATRSNAELKKLVGVTLLPTNTDEVKSAFLRGDKDTSKASVAFAGAPDEAALKKAAEERRKLAELSARAVVEVEEQAAKDAGDAWKVWEALQIDAAKTRADAFKEQWQQVFEFIDAEQERAIQEGQDFLDAQKKAGEDIGRELGLVFSSAAGKAIADFQDLRSVLKGILADIAQIAIKKTITEPISKAVGGFFDGVDWGGMLGGLFGGFRAAGGPVQAGKAYVVGERRPELFVPRTSGAIVPTTAGATVNANFYFAPGAKADDFGKSRRQLEADFGRTLRRVGVIA